jgi:fluoroacetyl-CoA thioesterase
MRQIPIGAKGCWVLEVKDEHLACRVKDMALPPVLATPVMIMVMENAALNAVRTYLEPGEAALGTRVDIRHLSPTAAGMRVVGEARVTRVDGRRIEFWVSAMDESGQIGTGTHERTIVTVARMKQHLEAKRAAQAHLRSMIGGS